MKALTLHPEWAHAIAHLGKRTENRTWRPPEALIGQRIAIHAGASIGGGRGRDAEDVALNAISRIAGAWVCAGDVRRRAVVAVATIQSVDDDHRAPWDVAGQWHWRLSGVVTLASPVPVARGRLGLWRLDDHTEAAVIAAMETP